MPLWEMSQDRTSILEVGRTTLQAESIRERGDLQAVLRDRIDVLDPDLFVIDEEFSDWDESSRRIDLLCIDRAANLVVVELKRDDTAHADLQAVRYASMVATMKFDEAVGFHSRYRGRRGIGGDAREEILRHLGWPVPNEDAFAADVRIVLVASNFDDKELTSAVLWLRNRQIDIRCVTLEPYRFVENGGGIRILLDVRQIIPPPQTSEMTIKIEAKVARQREARESARESGRDTRKFDIRAYGESRSRLGFGPSALFIIKSAIERGALLPDDVLAIGAKTRGLRAGLMVGFPGTLSPEGFADALVSNQSAFRGFRGQTDLIVSGGKTWSVTTEWTGAWLDLFLRVLTEQHPALDIEISVSEDL